MVHFYQTILNLFPFCVITLPLLSTQMLYCWLYKCTADCTSVHCPIYSYSILIWLWTMVVITHAWILDSVYIKVFKLCSRLPNRIQELWLGHEGRTDLMAWASKLQLSHHGILNSVDYYSTKYKVKSVWIIQRCLRLWALLCCNDYTTGCLATMISGLDCIKYKEKRLA